MNYSLTRLLPALMLLLTANLVYGIDATALNIAGQQRMLSQRIVKSWCQIGLNVQPDISKSQLDDAIRSFEGNLKMLEGSATSPKAHTALGGLRAAWSPFRVALSGVIRQSDAAQLDARAEDVLMAAERLSRVLQDESATPVSRWVNLAGRQRMLSQRLVKIYMLQQWGITSAALRDETDRIQHEFSGAMQSMQRREGNSPELRGELENLALQWEWLHTALATEGAESFRLIIAESSEAVLQLADQVTRLYDQPEQ